MKTFKIVALQTFEDMKPINIPLTDGLIINKENDHGDWIIEAFIDQSLAPLFQKKWEEDRPFEIRVVITHAANDPAPFTAKIHKIRPVGERISVLFDGKLSKLRNEYSEHILEGLISEGFTGEALMIEFKKRMKKPV
ncbi:YwpF-like family protein [Bacillus sp. FJAT-50079]|uniref:YwpF-like family protein n=1 Tax=Bacillus sp. FJAT-50079 TaxID=2833577 RepID=UPI001BC973CF|nr:YwpF-like family protein [Bacillus sp. FJAT-50079]MBS4206775.1 YwpF-like family protein [Bacillus sp. FJAT-50079]